MLGMERCYVHPHAFGRQRRCACCHLLRRRVHAPLRPLASSSTDAIRAMALMLRREERRARKGRECAGSFRHCGGEEGEWLRWGQEREGGTRAAGGEREDEGGGHSTLSDTARIAFDMRRSGSSRRIWGQGDWMQRRRGCGVNYTSWNVRCRYGRSSNDAAENTRQAQLVRIPQCAEMGKCSPQMTYIRTLGRKELCIFERGDREIKWEVGGEIEGWVCGVAWKAKRKELG